MDYTYERAILLANNLCYVVDRFLADEVDEPVVRRAMVEYDEYVNGDGLFEVWRVAARECGEYTEILA